MLNVRIYLIVTVIAMLICPANILVQNSSAQEQIIKKIGSNNNSLNIDTNGMLRPVLAIAPYKIDLGVVLPDEAVIGEFTFQNIGSGIMEWSTVGPEGWTAVENEKLSSVVVDEANHLRVEIRLLPSGQAENGIRSKTHLHKVEMKLEAENGKLICQKDMLAGKKKEEIKITSVGGLRTIYVTFKIISAQNAPVINLNPERLDMGCEFTGKSISKKIRVTNKGKEMLKWSVAVQKPKRTDNPANFKKGRYISFVNEELRKSGTYKPPAHLKDSMELIGKWKEDDGYPYSNGDGNSIKLRFNGTGISVYLATYPGVGNLTVYVDENVVNSHDWFGEKKEKGELLVAEDLIDGPHTLTLVNKEGSLELEGVKILGKDITRGPTGWIIIINDSGTTTVQTNYVSIKLNTDQLTPGLYGDNIVFNTNGGEEIAEVYIEILPDNTPKIVDIYRYKKGLDYLFTANPQAESKRLMQNAYVKEGIAFRLFSSDTPGTTNFYRWYNSQTNDHYYHFNPKGGGKSMQGYVLEGSIGNIATSKMANTKELYRWVNPSTNHHFYTTDVKGSPVLKKGYRFDGIAGYVKLTL